jgi:hypothetical protein
LAAVRDSGGRAPAGGGQAGPVVYPADDGHQALPARRWQLALSLCRSVRGRPEEGDPGRAGARN